MKIVAVLIPFVLLGATVLFVAFSGGPSAAREAYRSRGGRVFRISMVVIYVGFGIGVPALILSSREEATGGTGALSKAGLSGDAEKGKMLFRQQCASCHSLAAVSAHGVTGPNLDKIGEVTPGRVLSAIKTGGTGKGRMPAGLLEGPEAQEVATYVSEVAGK
jgi:cytochrome c553